MQSQEPKKYRPALVLVSASLLDSIAEKHDNLLIKNKALTKKLRLSEYRLQLAKATIKSFEQHPT
jgi:hypothetical protein